MAGGLLPTEFAKAMNDTARELESRLTKVVRKVAADMSAHVIAATPVDTGRARGNWFPSIGSPSTRADWNRFSPDPASQASEAAAVADTLRLGQTFWLSNNLDYIEVLNEGYSRQAPAGFVQSLVSEAEQIGNAAWAEVMSGFDSGNFRGGGR